MDISLRLAGHQGTAHLFEADSKHLNDVQLFMT
jgi:hypothetical protein